MVSKKVRPKTDTPTLKVRTPGKIVVNNKKLIDLANGGDCTDEYRHLFNSTHIF